MLCFNVSCIFTIQLNSHSEHLPNKQTKIRWIIGTLCIYVFAGENCKLWSSIFETRVSNYCEYLRQSYNFPFFLYHHWPVWAACLLCHVFVSPYLGMFIIEYLLFFPPFLLSSIHRVMYPSWTLGRDFSHATCTGVYGTVGIVL